MNLPRIVSEDEWAAARKEFLVKEKEATNQRDLLNAERRELPMVEVTKAYEFEGADGKVSLLDLFEGRKQLIIYHFMFHPEWEDGCPSCTAGADELSPGFLEHLHTRDTSYAMVSRAPLAKLERWKAKRGWEIPVYSSSDGDFNYDFGVTVDASRGFDEFNFRTLDEYAAMGQESMKTSEQPYDMPGRTCFLQVDGRVFRTYSQYARGLEGTGGSYYFLDLTALGRQEDWEEPKGRSEAARGEHPRLRVVMGNPIVHFELIGPAPDQLRKLFYRDLFGWEFDTSGVVSDAVSEPTNYGFVEPGASGVAVGVGGGDGYPAKTVVYVGVADVEAALQRAESLGGVRVLGPARRPDEQLVIGQFTDPQGNIVGVAGPA